MGAERARAGTAREKKPRPGQRDRVCAHMYHRSDLSDSMDDWLCTQAFLTQLINLIRETDV